MIELRGPKARRRALCESESELQEGGRNAVRRDGDAIPDAPRSAGILRPLDTDLPLSMYAG